MNLNKLISIPRSILINIALFGLGGGIKCPLLVSNDIKCSGLKKNRITLDSMKFASVEIGFQGTKGLRREKGFFIIGEEGEVHFKGKAFIASGSTIRVDRGKLVLGDNFSCNNNCFISCSEGVEIGSDALLGWNVNIRDSDGHTVIQDGVNKPSRKQVFIGEHVWIAANVDILKGSVIPDNTVVAYRSCVTSRFSERNTLIGGYPAKVLQSGIDWLR